VSPSIPSPQQLRAGYCQSDGPSCIPKRKLRVGSVLSLSLICVSYKLLLLLMCILSYICVSFVSHRFVSADFKQKATAYLCLSQFRYFNRSQVEVYLYATTPDSDHQPSEWRSMLRKESDHFREIDAQLKGMSGLEASTIVASDQIDVLIDLDGYSNEGLRRSELFVVRHAPVTVSW
jgi:hypothetical protein